MTKTTTSRPI